MGQGKIGQRTERFLKEPKVDAVTSEVATGGFSSPHGPQPHPKEITGGRGAGEPLGNRQRYGGEFKKQDVQKKIGQRTERFLKSKKQTKVTDKVGDRGPNFMSKKQRKLTGKVGTEGFSSSQYVKSKYARGGSGTVLSLANRKSLHDRFYEYCEKQVRRENLPGRILPLGSECRQSLQESNLMNCPEEA